MGLDMYLYANRFLWSYEGAKDAQTSKAIAELCEVPNAQVSEVKVKAAYWRKSNQIHKWFVDNVQNGVDDCGYYDVSREQLRSLLEAVKKAKASRESAKELLPTVGGFFFGSTEYDEYYDEDLAETEKQITKALELSKDWDFQYHSSW